ncbi:predicted protein [Sclerotinia sclerotiorum 1980 UF-70]|uniref:Uncharacterized protein n=1 Tax=Sclerotinia sclerotiorum (strain ATCC 18683 / 1980 / Ss-1) TaxID=665079 RepID=A7E591_SCLS1|nr:predicted protein [Sclerotinia sclerotiorum 1980 UF-70]EDN91063.1 predicted protein [Sclerotinia sclerotiorum 1980 UF-70]
MGDQQPEDDIDLPNTTPEFHIARQHLENRLAAEREAPPPFPNILEPPLQEDGLPIPRNRQIEQLEDVALPHVYSLLLQYAETPNLPISVQHLRDNLWALMHDEDIPWPENLDFPSVFPELELAALQEIQYHIRRLTHERLRDPIPRDNAPNTPEWILALFPPYHCLHFRTQLSSKRYVNIIRKYITALLGIDHAKSLRLILLC